MMTLYETVMRKAEDAGAREPTVGDCSGEACIVDIDTGATWLIELKQIIGPHED